MPFVGLGRRQDLPSPRPPPPSPPPPPPPPPPLAWRVDGLVSPIDTSCPVYDDLKKEPGCQIRCRDANCSNAWEAIGRYPIGRAFHLEANNCPPLTGFYATVKHGSSPDGLRADLCQQACSSRLDRGIMRARMRHYTPLCQHGTSSLSLVDGYLLASQILIDASRATSCISAERKFNPGFLRYSCTPTGEFSGLHQRGLDRLSVLLRGREQTTPEAIAERRRANSSSEELFTIFASRDDMGNLGHHMGDLLGVWHLVDHLQLTPRTAQLVLTDVKLMCYRPCMLDCPGPFRMLWRAVTNGMRVIKLNDWAGRGAVHVRESAFHTRWPSSALLAWGDPMCAASPHLMRRPRLLLGSSPHARFVLRRCAVAVRAPR